MGQKQHKTGRNNLIIELNPITNSHYEIYLYNFKDSNHYKSIIPITLINDMFKIKQKQKLIEYIEETGEIFLKQTNSLILSFNLGQNKYKFELYNIEDYKNIIYLLITLDYLFISLMLTLFLNIFQYSTSYKFFFLKLLHFLIMGILFGCYIIYRYYQIFESYYYKFDYKEHFYYILYFLIPFLINLILITGTIFVITTDMENLCLLASLGLEIFIIYYWIKEHFEKKTFKDVKKYSFEVMKNIKKYIKNIFKKIKN